MTELIAVYGGMTLLTAAITVHHQQFSSKADTLKALVQGVGAGADSSSPDVLGLIEQARSVYDYRNTLIHAMWGIGDKDSPITTRFIARGKFRHSRQHQPTERILECAREADELADALGELRDHLASGHSEP